MQIQENFQLLYSILQRFNNLPKFQYQISKCSSAKEKKIAKNTNLVSDLKLRKRFKGLQVKGLWAMICF